MPWSAHSLCYTRTSSLACARCDLIDPRTLLILVSEVTWMPWIGVNALDRNMGMAMLHAENQLRIPPRKYAWSPELRKAGLLLRSWKSWLSDFYQEWDSHHTHHTLTWQRLQQDDRQYQLPSADDMSDVEIRYQISQYCVHLRTKVQKTISRAGSKTLRSFWPNMKATIVSNMIHTEKIQTMFRKIGHAVKPKQSRGIPTTPTLSRTST